MVAEVERVDGRVEGERQERADDDEEEAHSDVHANSWWLRALAIKK